MDEFSNIWIEQCDAAREIRRHLLSSYPELLPDARQAANALLATVSFTDIAGGSSRHSSRSTWMIRMQDRLRPGTSSLQKRPGR